MEDTHNNLGTAFTSAEKERLRIIEESLVIKLADEWMLTSVQRATHHKPGEDYNDGGLGFSEFGDKRLTYIDFLPNSFKNIEELINWYSEEVIYVSKYFASFIQQFGMASLLASRGAKDDNYVNIYIKGTGYLAIRNVLFEFEKKFVTVEYSWF